MREHVATRFDWLDEELGKRPWMAGNRFTVADITALCAIDFGKVSNIRIDAAKHIQPSELDGIVSLVNTAATTDGRAQPYWYGEVIDYGSEGVRASEYYGLGYRSGGASDISEFKYRGIGDKFINLGTQKVGELAQFTPGAWGLMASDKAVSFIENHDTQRDGTPISYRDGQTLRLAYVWLLGYPYG